MCLILFAREPNSRYRLVLAANRDEFYERPTSAAGFWEDGTGILAGRDLRRGGTWLGVTKSGRFAAVTNFRSPEDRRERPGSRGHLVSDFLECTDSPSEYIRRLRANSDDYGGFNLLAGDAGEMWWLSNYGESSRQLEPGVYGLSNHLLDTPWPKVERGKRALRRLLDAEAEISTDDLFTVLADENPAEDHELPDTGVGVELERLLSAPFIRSEQYGTRSSTVLLIEHDGDATFVERRFGLEENETPTETSYRFRIEP